MTCTDSNVQRIESRRKNRNAWAALHERMWIRTEEEDEEREETDKGTQGNYEKAWVKSGKLAGGKKSAGQHFGCEPDLAPFREKAGL